MVKDGVVVHPSCDGYITTFGWFNPHVALKSYQGSRARQGLDGTSGHRPATAPDTENR